MNSGKVLSFSKHDQENLEHIADLLHLFHHRNKNQHRRSIWWRHFSTFRRQLNALVEDIRGLNKIPTTHLERTKKKARDKETQNKISERLTFWQDVLVSKWQNAFSQAVADGRFSVLGLVLTAALAQVCQIVGITTTFEDLGQTEVEKVLDEFSREQSWDDGGHANVSADGEEDVGQVVARGEVKADDRFDTNTVPHGHKKIVRDKATAKPSKATTQPARKKRRKGNAIDDLFSGLD